MERLTIDVGPGIAYCPFCGHCLCASAEFSSEEHLQQSKNPCEHLRITVGPQQYNEDIFGIEPSMSKQAEAAKLVDVLKQLKAEGTEFCEYMQRAELESLIDETFSHIDFVIESVYSTGGCHIIEERWYLFCMSERMPIPDEYLEAVTA